MLRRAPLLALLSAWLASTAWAQVQVVIPQVPVAPALGQVGAMLRQAMVPAAQAPIGIAFSGNLLLPSPAVQIAPSELLLPGGPRLLEATRRPSVAGSLVAVVPGSALGALAQGVAAQKLLILLDRASQQSNARAAESATAKPAPLEARAMLKRAAAELEAMPLERLRSMPLEELNAWSERLLEGGVARPASSVQGTAGASATLASQLRTASKDAPKAEPAPSVPTPVVPSPAVETINKKTVFGLFSQRSLSIAVFVATTIAYPFAAVPVVGWAGFGILMAFGPMAGIAAGPIAGKIIDRMHTKKAMAINAALVGVLQLVLPAFWYFGVLNFGTLLVASLAQGWLLSTVMITEGAFLKRLFPLKYLGSINGLLQINYFAIQVILGLLVGLGQIVDKWNPFAVFAGAAAVNLLLVVPLILAFIPNVAPLPSAAPQAGAAAPKVPFLKRNWPQLLVFAAALASYPFLHSPLPIAASLIFWIARSANFSLIWKGEGAEPMENAEPVAARGRLRYAMLFLSLGALLFYPLQVLVLPAIAGTLAGVAGKGLLLGQFLGSLFLGNMLSTAALAKLPEIKVPFIGKMGLERVVQALVVALAAATSFIRLAPGDFVMAAGAALATVGLIAFAQRLTSRGWIQFLGVGLSAVWLPYLAWAGLLPFLSVPVAMMLSLVVAGMSFGPNFVSLITYFQRSARSSEMGKIGGIQGSFFNAAISTGIGLTALAATALTPTYPALLAVLGVAYAVGGVLFWLAPSRLPGLPATWFNPKEKKG